MSEFEAIYALVAQVDEALDSGRVYYRRRSDGALLTTLDEVVRAVEAGDLARPSTGSGCSSTGSGGLVERPFSRVLIGPPSAEEFRADKAWFGLMLRVRCYD